MLMIGFWKPVFILDFYILYGYKEEKSSTGNTHYQ